MATCDISCEPMDIDLSTQSDNAMDVSCQEDSIERSPTPVINQTVIYDETCNSVVEDQEQLIGFKVNRISKDNTRGQNKRPYVFNSFGLFISLVFLMLSIVVYLCNIECNDELKLPLRDTLTSRVYGQTVAIENFIKALDNNYSSKLIILYGGTGVGKTLTISLVLNSIINYTNTYHYTMPSLQQTFSSEFMLGLILCKTSTIIIDDLTISDTKIRGIVNELLVKSRNLKKKMTIILVYNCDNTVSKSEHSCNEKYVSDLKLKFHDIEVDKTYVKFEPLTEESLQKCIQYEVGPLSKSKMLQMMKNFNVHQDGCKGVHQKTKYLNIV